MRSSVLAMAALTLLAFTGFAPDATPPQDWLEWQAKRRESVAGTNGWTTLVGRHWLVEGTNFAGAAGTNQVILPATRADENIGAFIRQGRRVRFEAAPGIRAAVNGVVIRSTDLESDRSDRPTRLVVGPLSFVVLERGDRLGVRVRDPEAPTRRQFTGLKCFPYDPSWRLTGRFEPFAAPRALRVPDILGGAQEYVSPGALVFRRGDAEWRLEVVEEPGEADFFVMFRDTTAGVTTYESGRFLYVARPDARREVIIDFNRAYTPPCGFTAFATCPLPPRQNWLPIAVNAGELRPGQPP